ncbi:unnamed protein product [Adineta steineri]|uniref:Uncharacterized protein n=1 Tax=Adineta steineri TaxID=433720 RepID=A0A815UEV3_9BILA|nr:unnamed protein product [Adineta steineri]CAF1518846.1 unnamed protein product [Adineta steineri]CAF1649559.1 unnamed protein product [Adineta steineri]CAF1649564.1 unnamed protein product [Adineta steineri]
MGNNNSEQLETHFDDEFFCSQFDGLSLKPSAFYNACKEGNIAVLRQHLRPLLHKNRLHRIEPNGDIALHAAARAGHALVVELLLTNGFSCTMVNQEGKTAYESALNDEIRHLFHRSISERYSRFNDKNVDKTLNILNKNIHNERVVKQSKDAIQSRYMNRFHRMPKCFRNIIKKLTEARSIEAFEHIIGNLGFSPDNMTGNHMLIQTIFDDYLQTKNANSLIHLYTLNDLYREIREHSDAYTTLIYLHLASLSQRAYQGTCYRGIRMSKFDVTRYYYAMRYNCIIETYNFASTSKVKNVSLLYSGHSETCDQHLYSVLFIFEFSNSCKTAIDLTRVSENLPPLSQYPDEEEVLILPYTLFKVLTVIEATDNEPFTIFLQNIPVPDQSLLSFMYMNQKRLV